jgi:hypothetical protein
VEVEVGLLDTVYLNHVWKKEMSEKPQVDHMIQNSEQDMLIHETKHRRRELEFCFLNTKKVIH